MIDINALAINYLLTMVSVLFIVLFTQLIYNFRFKKRRVAFYVALVSLPSSFVAFFASCYGINLWSVFLFIINYLFCFVVLMRLCFRLAPFRCVMSAGIYALVLSLGFVLAYFVRCMFGCDSKYVREAFWRLVFAHIIINTVNIAVYAVVRSFKIITKYPKEIKIKAYIINTFYVVFALGAASYNFWYFYNSPARELNGLLFIFNTGLLLSFFIFNVLNTNTLFDFEFKNQELNYQVFYNRTLDKLMSDLRVFKHNYDNMLASVKSLIEARQIDELEKYINETVEKKNKIDVINNLMLLNIKNAGVLGIITSKQEYAKKMDVDIKVLVQDEVKEIDIKISDLCEILGILLDNAIEAASESKERLVGIDIKKDDGIITFCIENSIKDKPLIGKIFEKDYSTKGKNRGLGLWILRGIINNYNNILLNTFAGDKVFRQELIIY